MYSMSEYTGSSANLPPLKDHSRRDFLRLTALGVAGLALETVCAPVRRKAPTENLKVEDILLGIKEKYGVLIPTKEEPTYSKKDVQLGFTTPNHVPNMEEAQIIEEAISKIPSAGYLSPLMIPFLHISEGAVAGGHFVGRDWPASLRPGEYKLPPDRFLDDKAAIILLIPLVDLDRPLPTKNENTSNLPPLSQISLENAKVKVNLEEVVPWTNGRERLKQTVLHEFFHAFDERVSLENSSSVSEYRKRQGFYIWNKNTNDITNPLYVTFARVTGWKLIPITDYIAQYDPEEAKKKRNVNEKPPLVWDMDPEVWGDLAHRRGGPTIYSRYGPIQESIAEYWMTSVLYPHLLTANERRYFDNIKNGLKGNPEKFVKEVVKNPNILLKGIVA